MKTLFFLKARCGKTSRDFYIRHDFAADDRWVLTYGLKDIPIGETITGATAEVDYTAVRIGPQYKCPHCGNIYFVHCSACHGYVCHPGNHVTRDFNCTYCGNKGKVSLDKFIESVRTQNTGTGQ